MGVYINGIGYISPQGVGNPRDSISFLHDVKHYNARMIQCPEPEVNTGLEDKYVRRMSRMIRLGWTAAKLCMDDAGNLRPDAIITGSGWGSVQDSEKFLLSIYRNNENLLPPTPFIQSTHNAVGAQVAMLLDSYDYNMCYAHASFAFEHALLDSMMRLEDGSSRKVLCGGFDEITANQFILFDRLEWWRKAPVSNLELLQSPGEGTISGEGFQFFFLQSESNERTYAEVKGVETLINATDSQMNTEEIDWVFAGLNGDEENDRIYHEFIQEHWPGGMNVAAWKHLTGEYLTSSAFAMWAAAKSLKNGQIADILKVREENAGKPLRNILIYNHYKGKYHSFALLSRPD